MLHAGFFLLALFAHSAPTFGASQAPESQPEVNARLISNLAALAPGCAFELGVQLTIPEGWHVYWQNPGDTGVATSARLTAPAGFEVEGPLFPGPLRHEDGGGLVSFVHEGELLLFFRVRAPVELTGPQRFSARVKWLVCREACFTGSAEPELELAVAGEPKPADDKTLKFFEAQRRLLPRAWSELAPSPAVEWLDVPVPEGERERFACRIELSGVDGATFFPDPRSELELVRQSLEPSGTWQRLALELARPDGAPATEPPRALGVVRLEKGPEVTYFRVDLRREPQPLPRK